MGQRSNFYVDVRALHSEVTGSCFVCKISFSNGEKRFFLVDIGMFQEKEYLDWNEKLTFNPEDIAFTLLTHNHVDHVGRLPLLYRRGCKSKVYASVGTAMALPINLEDTLKIFLEKKKNSKKLSMRPENRNNGFKSQYYSELYKKEDVEQVYDYLTPVEYGEWNTDEKLPNVSFKFLPNAHLPGAAMIWVKIEDKDVEQTVNLLFLGDWNVSNVFQGKFDFPEELREVPLHVISEATYGDTKKEEISQSFQQNIVEAIENSKLVLLPVISQYRAQEMLWYVKEMKEQGRIMYDTPVYFAGPLGMKYTKLYQEDEFPGFIAGRKDFLPGSLEILNAKGALKNIPIDSGIYVVTGGMGSNGPSQSYLGKFLPYENVLVQFTSYCAEDTVGRKLQETGQGEEIVIGGKLVQKNADVRFTSEFSGHAKADELLKFISGFLKIKVLIVAHGDTDKKKAFKRLVEDANVAKEVTIVDRNNYVRLNPWGILDKKIWKD